MKANYIPCIQIAREVKEKKKGRGGWRRGRGRKGRRRRRGWRKDENDFN